MHPTKDNLAQLESHRKGDEVPVHLPNGMVLQFPRNIFFIFECESLAHAPPSLLSEVALIGTEEDSFDWNCILKRQKERVWEIHSKMFKEYDIQKSALDDPVDDFVFPFVGKLSQSVPINQRMLVHHFF